jgi:UDP-N-acetyl-D-mannosaminuronate dehydrogenase
MITKVDTLDSNVVVVGLGYVGLTLSAHLANIGFSVHGVEIRDSVLESLNQRKSFFVRCETQRTPFAVSRLFFL